MTRKSTRRDFLQGKAAAEALADLAEKSTAPAGPGKPPGPSPAETYLVHVSRPAMACQFELMLNAGQYANGTEAALEALDVVGALENQMSYFQPTSQISRLNALAADTPIEVEPRLFELLKLAIELHGQTEGAFDIAAGAVWEVWGFSRRAGKIPSDAELAGALASVGSHLVQLDPERRTVRLAKPGVRLNLGSLGKGYALDRAGELLAGAGIADYLFHGGQSSILARGSRLGLSSGQTGLPQSGWTVGIRHPLAPKRRLAELRLRDRALGTSGSTQQFFRHRGRRYAHILDPRTGQPAQGVLSATVVAPSATLADALSTALFVMGPERGLQFLHSRPEVAAVLVCPAVGRGGFEVITAGFSREQLTLL